MSQGHGRLLSLLLLLAASQPARAVGQPLPGTKLLIKQRSSGVAKVVWISKDPTVSLPANDPRCVADGGSQADVSLEIDLSDGSAKALDLSGDCSHWKATSAGVLLYRPVATVDTCRLIKIRPGKLVTRQ
jgi:hypothetical protein